MFNKSSKSHSPSEEELHNYKISRVISHLTENASHLILFAELENTVHVFRYNLLEKSLHRMKTQASKNWLLNRYFLVTPDSKGNAFTFGHSY